MTINICLATDENYLKYMATTIVSILTSANKNDKLHFYILCNDLSTSSKQYIKNLMRFKIFDIDFIDINIKDFANFPAGGPHISNTTYYRYKIADICKNIDKIIYLDCDMIVKTSLSELFNEDISDYYLGGVEDVGYYYWRDKNPNFKCSGFYINAGMLLINLNSWRENNIGDKLMEYTSKHYNEIIIGDQDVINIVCKNNIRPLKYQYNVQDSFYRQKLEVAKNPNKKRIIKASKNPVIIHYTNTRKPWDDLNMNRAEDWYFSYLILTDGELDNGLKMKIKIHMYQNLLNIKNSDKSLKKIFKFLENIFSIKNDFTQKHKRKIITLFGIRIKYKLVDKCKIC